MGDYAVEMINICKGFGGVSVLKDVNFSMEEGEYVAIMGPSGSGKTTLMNIIGCLDKPTEGKVLIEGTELSAMNRTQAAIFRRRKVGLVYQFYNLIPTLTVRKNILMPLLLDKRKPNKEYFEQIVHSLGIEDKLEALPSQLSGGQQQRVMIARAMISNPRLLILDEPTTGVDATSTKALYDTLYEINTKYKTTIFMITHGRLQDCKGCDRILRMDEGRIEEQ